MDTPKISVIVPTFNRGSFVAACIESVLRQTVPVSEIIVMDDGSTDDTREVVEVYLGKFPKLLQYFHQENGGKSVALNNALPHATGELIAFLDSDDTWLPEKLEWQLQAMRQFGMERPCFTDAQYVNNPALQQTAFKFADKRYSGDMSLVEDPASLFLTNRSGIYIQTLLLRRSVLEAVGEFDPALWVGNDTDYLFRLALMGPFCVVNKPLVAIDRTVNRAPGLIDMMSQDEHLRIREREHLYRKWLRLTSARPDLRKKLLARVAENQNDWANWHLQRREYTKARSAMIRAVETQFGAGSVLKLALMTIAPALARKEYLRRDLARARVRLTT